MHRRRSAGQKPGINGQESLSWPKLLKKVIRLETNRTGVQQRIDGWNMNCLPLYEPTWVTTISYIYLFIFFLSSPRPRHKWVTLLARDRINARAVCKARKRFYFFFLVVVLFFFKVEWCGQTASIYWSHAWYRLVDRSDPTSQSSLRRKTAGGQSSL